MKSVSSRERSSEILDVLWIAFGVVVLGAAVALNIRLGFASPGEIGSPSAQTHPDFDTFWRSAGAFLRGTDVYATGAKFQNLNPPFFVLLSAPLGLLPELTAYRAFSLLSVAALAFALALMAGAARLRSEGTVLVAVSLLVSSPMLATLILGQIYAVLALGLTLAWVADRRGLYRTSGVALGLVVALKPSLLPILLWPVVARRWGTLVAALVSGAAATLAAIPVLGPRATWNWLGLLRSHASNTYADNSSLPAAAARFFTQNPDGARIAALPIAVIVSQLAGLALILLTALWAWREYDAGTPASHPYALWALVGASLLASPITWHNYLLLLAPGIVLLAATGRGALAFLLLALQLIPPQWPQLFPNPNAMETATWLTLYTYMLIVHWLAFLKPTRGHLSARDRPRREER